MVTEIVSGRTLPLGLSGLMCGGVAFMLYTSLYAVAGRTLPRKVRKMKKVRFRRGSDRGGELAASEWALAGRRASLGAGAGPLDPRFRECEVLRDC